MNVFKGVIAAAVVAIWLTLGYRLLGPSDGVDVARVTEERVRDAPEVVDYELELAFAKPLFRLPPRTSSGRPPGSVTPDRARPTGGAARTPASRPAPAPADVEELTYVGYVQADDAQPTALLRYGARTSYARVDGGVAAYRVLVITPDSVRVLHTPTATEHSLGIQF